MDIFEIKHKINTDIFDYQALSMAIEGQSHKRRYISILVRKNYILRIKKGLYTWGAKVRNSPLQLETIANLIYGPSYLALESAFSFYGLIPERVETFISMTTKRNKTFLTPVGEFEYIYQNPKKFSIGNTLINNASQKFLISTKEKTLIDYLIYRVKEKPRNVSFLEILHKDLRIDESLMENINIIDLKNFAKVYKEKIVKEFIKEIT